ncbi:CDP-alcohol phosphatidyltransferase family protein [Actinomadura alba]|uniref:CDP-alcohol phosphatidyltransferase family protein n=1 Tax=Actinomadura alba TaxID=406431 RepID=A0ABR7LYJ5_9ACTN|nr:CDP-alcohol phosphatidyltransferase family protein [Actinomadura alba]MBC6469758.1 CDP-alcohol phosphatidyltransferase family protein [Actinomadura alba]
MSEQSTELEQAPDRVWTVPNALSLARLLAVPVFFWLVLIEADWWALGLLVAAGLSDWLDGRLARMLNQFSRLGAVLDPAADRLYIFATLVGLTIRDIVPLWLTALLLARELFMALLLAVMRRLGYEAFPVHFVGKAATLCLLYAFPLLLWGDHPGGAAATAKIIGWAFAIWGTALYWWAAALYAVQVRRLLGGRTTPPLDPDRGLQAADPSQVGGRTPGTGA